VLVAEPLRQRGGALLAPADLRIVAAGDRWAKTCLNVAKLTASRQRRVASLDHLGIDSDGRTHSVGTGQDVLLKMSSSGLEKLTTSA
jgi:hypothetical protein